MIETRKAYIKDTENRRRPCLSHYNILIGQKDNNLYVIWMGGPYVFKCGVASGISIEIVPCGCDYWLGYEQFLFMINNEGEAISMISKSNWIL